MNFLLSLLREYRETAAIKKYRRRLAIVRKVEAELMCDAIDKWLEACEQEQEA